MFDFDDANSKSVLERAKLFQAFEPLKPRGPHPREPHKEVLPVGVKSRMLTIIRQQARIAAQRLLKRQARGGPDEWHGRAGEIKGKAAPVCNHLDYVRAKYVLDRINRL